MGKNQEKFLCVKTMSRQLEMREGEQLQGGRELDVRECSVKAWRGECVRGSEKQVNPVRGGEQKIVRPA